MAHASAMDKLDSLQKLPRHAKNSFRVKCILALTVVCKNHVYRRAEQLEDQALVDSVRSLVRKGIEQLNNVFRVKAFFMSMAFKEIQIS